MKKMMKNPNITFLLGAVFTSVLGVLGHFLYEWTGSNPLIGLFCAINESTWEHLKLLFFPFLLWCFLARYLSSRKQECFWGIYAAGCFAGLLTIVAVFYTYTGILGFSIDAINIGLYFLGVLVCFWLCCLYTKKKHCPLPDTAGILFFVIMTVLFVVFTRYPPHLGIFLPPT